MKGGVIAVSLLAAVASQGVERSFQITFRVVDDEGRPVAGAKAGVSWENTKATKPSERIKSDDGMTDENGQATLVGKPHASSISYGVSKEGYYAAWGLRYHFNGARFFRWQPWNPTVEVVLKRKRNPVPMYAKRVAMEIPVSGMDIGYDLSIGDWVAPYGKGTISDMVFRSEAEVKGDSHYRGELAITFPGKGNGLILFETPAERISPLRMPYEAPDEEYQSKRVWRSVRRYNSQEHRNEVYVDDSSKTSSFFIRVRTEMNSEGRLLKAMYGKIHAPFEYDPRGFDRNGATGRQAVFFTYYLNPDGTRNIEFDPKRNLLNPTDADRLEFRGLMP